MPTLTAISPSSGAPGTAITLTGTGFTSGARVGCPALVPTTYVSATELTASIPEDMSGAAGGEMVVGVYVFGEDGAVSGVQAFTVVFPRTELQTWTSIDLVCGEVPGFLRGERAAVSDAVIRNWMRSIAQTVNGTLLRRGISTDPAEWPVAASGSAMPSPVGVLEQIVRLGAAARLAGVVGAQFAEKEWGLAKDLRTQFERELKALGSGEYDRIFNEAAAVVQAGTLAFGGEVLTDAGDTTQAFTKQQVF